MSDIAQSPRAGPVHSTCSINTMAERLGGWARENMSTTRGERKVGWCGLGVEIEDIEWWGRNEGFRD